MADEHHQEGRKSPPAWETLTFSLTETDFMYQSCGEAESEPVWDGGKMVPFSDITVSPAAAFMSYGIGIFEGLKAQRVAGDRILLFRPDGNAQRFRKSAERLLMEPFPADQFVGAVRQVVRSNLRFVPPAQYGSFYVRPLEHAVEPKLGLGSCTRFLVTIFGSPVGNYFRGGAQQGVRLKVLEQGRTAPGGTGAAKTMGNYAGAIYVANRWKKEGFDDVLYLDSRHVKYLTETSGSNAFVRLRTGALVTPPLDDQILPGITRDSTIRIARDLLGIDVQERALSIDEVIAEGVEMFCTGTAWTLLSVREIVYRDRKIVLKAQDARQEILEILRSIQLGERDDPFGWIVEV
ncbi:MAG: branched-chain-amino-acid transaminase [Planctomycetes bacterium]|nr:branched-chain-amino-acid transaminase [Planctomycetota bacterium]